MSETANGLLLIENCRHVGTFDDQGRELEKCDILVDGPRIAAIGPGLRHARNLPPDVPFIDASTCLAIPGLVNTHHHLWQVLTRVMPEAQHYTLFNWLLTNYEVWKHMDPEAFRIGALVSLAELLLSGCTTASDMQYLFPVSQPVELIDEEIAAARELGIRFHPTRASMTLGKDDGGLPPMALVESPDRVLADYERVISKYHDDSPLSMLRIALAPCAPFNAREELFVETARVARRHKVLLHTHLAETTDENVYCNEKFGCRPLEYVCRLGWEGPDVWFAHAVQFDAGEIRRCAQSGMGVAHCPSANGRLGSGIAPVPQMVEAGVRVGIAVDGTSSNDCGSILAEVRMAFMLHRASQGVDALDARGALRIATRGGADVLRNPMIGRLQAGCAADIVLVDEDRLDWAGGASLDPLAALVFCGIQRPVDYTIVNGRIVVEKGRLCNKAEAALVRRANEITAALVEKERTKRRIGATVQAPGKA